MSMPDRRKLVKMIGVKIKNAREMLMISSGNMAARMGVTRSSYNKYEYANAFPSPSGLKIPANDFNISLDRSIADKGPIIY